MSALRLFCVRNRRTNACVLDNGEVVYFSNKMEAKRLRDTLPGGENEWKVSKGVDHRKFLPQHVVDVVANTPNKCSRSKKGGKNE